MLLVYVKAACPADNEETRIRPREKVAEVLRRLDVHWLLLSRPCAKAVDDHIESSEVLFRKVEDILLVVNLCLRVILVMAAEGDDFMTAAHCFRDDFLCDTAICCYNCNFHDKRSFSYTG